MLFIFKMKKRVIIVHGWDGNPDLGWMNWLRKALESKDFEVKSPEMPDKSNPKIGPWIKRLSETIGKADENTILIGHSIGCQTILRYLEGLPKKIQIGGAIFVAGWFSLINLETEQEKEIAKSWIESRIDFDKVKTHANKFVAILSDDDPWVDLRENKKIFEEELNAKVIIEHKKGHINESDNDKLPSVLNSLNEMVK